MDFSRMPTLNSSNNRNNSSLSSKREPTTTTPHTNNISDADDDDDSKMMTMMQDFSSYPKPSTLDFPQTASVFDFDDNGTYTTTTNNNNNNDDTFSLNIGTIGEIVSASENNDEFASEDDFSDENSEFGEDEEVEQEFLDSIKYSVPDLSEVNDRDIDAELAQELNKLSMRDREKALHDIHGVADKLDEAPKVVEKALKDLEEALEERRVGTPRGLAYNLAMERNAEYVRRDDFRLLFLRGHDFDVIPAAKMILHHFLIKKELFGDDKLCKDIELSDLTEADMECLRNGHFQLLPVCDQAGRQVFIHFMNNEKYKCPPNLGRVMWYTALTALRGKEAQQKGLVSVSWLHTPQGKKAESRPSPSAIHMLARSKEALPIRQICFHMCMNEGWSTTFVGWMRKYFMPSQNRVRTRLHSSTSQAEVLASMEKFGIPVDVFPLTPEGELKRDRHAGWIKTQQLIEEHRRTMGNDDKSKEGPQEVVSIPTQSDILLGRGKACQCHVGNLRFRLMLEDKYEAYDAADKNEKMDQATEIVNLVQSSGGRFLTLEGGMWVKVSDLVARKKVSHRFRAIRSARVLEQNNNNNKTTNHYGDGGGKRARTAN